MARTRKPEQVIEQGGRGMTYRKTTGYTVYELSTYERSSVLAGQQKRTWLDEFETLDAAQAAYPKATVIAGTSYQAPFLDHLPGDEDPDPHGDFDPNDY